MGSTYVRPTKEQFDTLLLPLGFQEIKLPRTKEIVYGRRQDDDGMYLSMRVYTSLDPSGSGRDVGTDAIRVTLWTRFWFAGDEEKEPGWVIRRVGGSKRVNRVAGWQDRLLERVQKWSEVRKCPACGNPMALREGKSGKFFGCTSYPLCKRTEAWKPPVKGDTV